MNFNFRIKMILGAAALLFAGSANAQTSTVGAESYRLGNYPAVIQEVDQAIASGNRSAEAYLMRGKAKFNMKSCECGTDDFDSAISMNSNLSEAYAARSIVRSCSGMIQPAKEDAKKAMDLDAKSGLSHLARAYQSILDSNYSEAITDLNIAMKKNPEWKGQIYTYRGMAYLGKGKYDFAKRDFNRALRVNPNNKDLYLLRADAYINKGRTAKAVKDYDKYLAINPNNHTVRFTKGLILLDDNKHKMAITEFSQVIDQSGGSPDYYMARGLAHARMANYTLALADFKVAEGLDNGEAKKFVVSPQDFHYYYGMSCYKCNMNGEALNQLNQLATLDKDYMGEAYYYKCKAKSKTKEEAGTCEDCSKALEMGFKNAKRYVNKVCKMPTAKTSMAN